LLLVNRRDLMGAHVNSRAFNLIAWSSSAIMIVLTVVMVGTLVLGY
jgi:Mn2+/Fe2+ NRAMP family transporter